ncbi:protein kinase domain-containing protein [Streptomyces boninensis]|uniref:serine/threonine-protein kinase n=1 Tax=Streptomyces boninensis TaxID=2039455 RepID=UPI003B20C450
MTGPETVGGYLLERRLGSGGMGTVHLGRSASGRRLAVKVVHSAFAEDPAFRERFRREVVAARRVSGAFTASVVDADPEAGRPWMATLYVAGRSLSERVAEGGPVGGPEFRGLALGLAEALVDIHRAGLVHRDLKPGNVLLDEADGSPKVIDFGIARAVDVGGLTATGQIFGTPPFMSPEQLTSGEVDALSDVFSLGSLLAYAATGHSPFEATSPHLAAYRVVHEAPDLEGVPQELRRVLEPCLAKDPRERPGAEELLHALRDNTAPRPGASGPPTPVPGAPRAPAVEDRPTTPLGAPARRPRRRRAALIALSLLLLAGGTTGAVIKFGLADGAGAEDWRPWQTTFSGGKASTVSFGCTDAGRGQLQCSGGGFTGETLNAGDGSPVKDAADGSPLWNDGRWQYRGDIGRRDGLVFTRSEDGKGDDGRSVIRAVDDRTRKERWSHDIVDGAAALTGDGVIGTQWKKADRDTATVGPGGDLTVWDPESGKEEARIETPDDRWCRPVAASSRTYVLCDDMDRTGGALPMETKVYGLDAKKEKLTETATLKNDAESPRGFPGYEAVHDGDLLFVPEAAEGEEYTAVHKELLRVDGRTGKLRRIELPSDLPGNSAPSLSGGTLFFTTRSGEVTAVDPDTGKRRWQATSPFGRLSAPAASPSRGEVYFTDGYGRLLVRDRTSGKELRRSETRRTELERGETLDLFATVRLTDGILVVAAGKTVFSVAPDDLDAKPQDRHTVRTD